MNGRATVWDVAEVLKIGREAPREVVKGQERALLNGHKSFVASVAFMPDGKILASGSHDKTAKLWEVATGKELATLTGHVGAVVTVAASPDRTILATGSYDRTVRLGEVPNRKELPTQPLQ